MYKKAKDLLGIILLGAVGSGVWSLIGEPSAGWVYNSAVYLGGSVSDFYVNTLNAGVGSGGYEQRGSVALFLLLNFFVHASLVYFPYKLVELLSFDIKVKRVFYVAIWSLFFYEGVGGCHKILYAHKANLYFNKNIDVLAPYIEEKERLIAISKYRLIDDKETMDDAQHYIFKLSKKAGIEIEAFSI